MAGTTEHYGLSLLGAEDEAGRGALNGNFERADAALEALARAMEEGLAGKAEVVWGLYTGLGSEETVTVELGFRPRAVIVSPHGSYSSGAGSGIYTMISLAESNCEFVTITDTGFIASKYMCYVQSNSNPYRYMAFR